MKNYYCPECSGDIEIGIAIEPVIEYSCRYISLVHPVNYKNMNIINVYKCKSCGYSCDEGFLANGYQPISSGKQPNPPPINP